MIFCDFWRFSNKSEIKWLETYTKNVLKKREKTQKLLQKITNIYFRFSSKISKNFRKFQICSWKLWFWCVQKSTSMLWSVDQNCSERTKSSKMVKNVKKTWKMWIFAKIGVPIASFSQKSLSKARIREFWRFCFT